MTDILTRNDVKLLSILMRQVSKGESVSFMRDYPDAPIVVGTVRSFVAPASLDTFDFYFPGWDEDIRECGIRVTTISGAELCISVQEAMHMLNDRRWSR